MSWLGSSYRRYNQMYKTPSAFDTPRTYEGAAIRRISPMQMLRRSVMSCLLFQDTHYESGQEIAIRIKELINRADIKPQAVAKIAVEAHTKMKLRDVPLFVARELIRRVSGAKERSLVVRALLGDVLRQIIDRPDQMVKFLELYWKDEPASTESVRRTRYSWERDLTKPIRTQHAKKAPLAAQVKKALADIFPKFSEYQLAKYNRDGAIKLRDVLFLCHAKPKDGTQAAMWKRLINGELQTPDTWEVALSATEHGTPSQKRAVWERLLVEGKLGGLALIRNLRNMVQVGVNTGIIKQTFDEMTAHGKFERVLPFRFITAARYAPQFEPELERAMFRCLDGMTKLPGKTTLCIDCSPSMESGLSGKSEMNRFEAAAALAILLRELCDDINIYTFSRQGKAKLIAPRRGFALRDLIFQQKDSYTYGGEAVRLANAAGYDRIVVLTDGEWHDECPEPLKDKFAYMVNIAAYKNGVGYGSWVSIDGWSESIFDYIQSFEMPINED